MEGTGSNLIEKILFWTIFLLTGKIDNSTNSDDSTKIYLDKINMLLDTYAPLKKLINIS